MQWLWMVLSLSACVAGSSRDLRIGAFNIKVFGVTKASKPDVMAILVKIIRRYDLILIQEIRDVTNTAIHTLLDQVNQGQTEPFSIVLSDRLGRTTSKEQYAFLYRSAAGLRVKGQYHYDDGSETLGVDQFQREPFIVAFTSDYTELRQFGLAGIHVDPDEAVQEINHLYGVFHDMTTKMAINDVMVMGDLNADCDYVTKSKWLKIPIKTDRLFTWWIGDEIDTNVNSRHCAYDRFISLGDNWQHGIVPGSAKAYRFDADPAIGTMKEESAVAVSDHYPIEFLLRGNTEYEQRIVFSVNDVFIALVQPTGSLTIDRLYDVQLSNSDELLVYDSVVLKGYLLLTIEDDQILLNGLKSIKGTDVKVRVKPIKNRYSGKQRSIMYIEIPTTKNWILEMCNMFIYLRCKYV